MAVASPPAAVTIKEIDALLSGATPQFSMQLKARVFSMIRELSAGDDVRSYGEMQMSMLDRLALGTSRCGREAGQPPVTDPAWKTLPSHPVSGAAR